MAYNTHKDLVKFESKLLSFISNPKSIFHRESTKKKQKVGTFCFFLFINIILFHKVIWTLFGFEKDLRKVFSNDTERQKL